MIKKTTPSQRALDEAIRPWNSAHDADIINPEIVKINAHLSRFASIIAHARTLDLLWERCPDLAPKTKGEMFAEEMRRRYSVTPSMGWTGIAAQMIDENWEPKP